MKGLERLRKKPRPFLDVMAEKLNIKVSKYWNRTTLAKKIIEAEKLKELDDHQDPNKSRGDVVSELNPELEAALADDQLVEDAQEGPGPPQDEKEADVGPKPPLSTGRTVGMTDEKARVKRLIENKVPDPVYVFALGKCFSAWQLFAKDVPGIKLTKDEAKLIGIPATNLMSYYFPNFKPTPVLEMWVGLYLSLELVIGSRLDLIRESRSESGPKRQVEKTVVEIMDRLRSMPPDQRSRFADMLGIKVEAE